MKSLIPSRADVNDVANAVHDRVDGVMLSGETSVGMYPVEVIQAMSKVLRSQENYANLEMEEFLPVKRTMEDIFLIQFAIMLVKLQSK